jgi:hypothetical protein
LKSEELKIPNIKITVVCLLRKVATPRLHFPEDLNHNTVAEYGLDDQGSISVGIKLSSILL